MVTAVLKHHTDMIDSLLKYNLPLKVTKVRNSHITWLLSTSRDRRITLWKLIDGKVMRRTDYQALKNPKGLHLASRQRMKQMFSR